MPYLRTLNSEELNELYDWLNSKHMILNNRTRRDLSNVVTIAGLFKNLNGRLINMQNYTSHSSLALKLENWETFNLKVLRRVGLTVSRKELENLAAGQIDTLKSLLYHLICVEKNGLNPQAILRENKTTQSGTEENGTVLKPHQQKAITKRGAHFTRKMIQKNMPLNKFELLVQKNHERDKYISSISHKIQYLQSLILVKEERIQDLMDRLVTLSARVLSIENPPSGEEERQEANIPN